LASLPSVTLRSMQHRELCLLTAVNRRSRERKGLEAIFSSKDSSTKTEALAGAAATLAGVLLAILAVLRTEEPQVLGTSANVIYSALTFGAIGALLLVSGVGTIAFAFTNRDSKLSNRAASRLETRRMFGPGSRMGAVAFFQSLVLVGLYSGFVQEFESNKTMQVWLRSNLPLGQTVLNWEGVIILSVLLGLLLLQFLPGRYFSE
jgi:hypothetical protein